MEATVRLHAPYCKNGAPDRMSLLSDTIEKIVTANRIRAREDVVDGFGHVSMRHPNDPTRYLLSRSRSPELVEPEALAEQKVQAAQTELAVLLAQEGPQQLHTLQDWLVIATALFRIHLIV